MAERSGAMWLRPKSSTLRPMSELAERQTVTLDDGSEVAIDARGVEVRDDGGRLLIRYRDGVTEVSAPRGDMVFRAPRGSVVLQAADDLRLEAGEDLCLEGAASMRARVPLSGEIALGSGRATVTSPRLELEGERTVLRARRMEVVSEQLHRWVDRLHTRAGEVELQAESLIERTGDVIRAAKNLVTQRAGRMRTEVDDVLMVRSGRTVLRSERETSVEAERVLLG